jgi:5-enolpyruvylshikimate-3-phosphate synthase
MPKTEQDRIAELEAELHRLKATVENRDRGVTIHGNAPAGQRDPSHRR